MRRQRRPCRLLAGKARDHASILFRLRNDRFGGAFILGYAGLQLLKLEFHLIEQLPAPLRRWAILGMVQLGDRQLEMGDHRLGRLARRALGQIRRFQRIDVVGERIVYLGHS